MLSQEKHATELAPHRTATGTMILDLPDDTLGVCFDFYGKGHYRFVGAVCSHFRRVYAQSRGQKTTWKSAAECIDRAEICLQEATNEKRDIVKGIAIGAAGTQQLNVLNWARSNGFQLEDSDYETAKSVLSEASRFGHVDVLEWANQLGIRWDFCEVARAAAEKGHLSVFEFLHKHGSKDLVHDPEVFRITLRNGHLAVLKWIVGKGYTGSFIRGQFRQARFHAARGGHVDVLDWLRTERKERMDHQVLIGGAYGGHMAVLKWAREQADIPWDVEACAYAALGGHFQLLKWLRENGCPWDSQVVRFARVTRHFEMLHWAIANGCPTTGF